MSDEAAAPKKQGGKGRMILIILVAVMMGGAGVAGGLYAAGAFSHAEEGPKEDPAKPRLVLKGEDPVAIAGKFGGGEGGHGEGGGEAGAAGHGFKLPKGGVDLPRPKDISAYQATYFQMPAPYTSNLSDTDSLVQIALAVSTYYDDRVIQAVKTHEMAIRSAVLMLLSQEQELELSTPQGKQALQKKLTVLINRILREKTGYSGIDNVYFTNFVIQ
ncbi:MAG: flagellar basal body-associated protein FliL [Sphingobium sp.]